MIQTERFIMPHYLVTYCVIPSTLHHITCHLYKLKNYQTNTISNLNHW